MTVKGKLSTEVEDTPAPAHTAVDSAGSRPLKIAHVLPAMDLGGMEIMVLSLAAESRARGHDASIICTEWLGTLEQRVRQRGIPISVVPAPGLASLIWPSELTAMFRRERFDVVHSHSGVNAKAVRAARSAGVPAILHTLHGVQHPLPLRDLAVVLLGAYQTPMNVGCSVDAQAFYEKWIPWGGDHNALVPNGIDVAGFNQSDGAVSLRETLGIDADRLVVGTVARLDAVKNQELLLDALLQLDDQWVLAMVGAGPREAALREHAARLGLTERVFFAGAQRAGRDLYRNFDVFALSSLSEAMPMTILEAFAAEVPVVATAVGGIPSLLQDGKLGRLAPLGDAVQFADAIRRTIAEPALTRDMVSLAFARLNARHTVAAMTTAYLALYERLLNGRRA